jgi:carbohydrate-binding DOMON domain-containing protein
MSTQYRLVQSGKTASGGCSAGQGSSEPVAPRIYFLLYFSFKEVSAEGKYESSTFIIVQNVYFFEKKLDMSQWFLDSK